MVPFFIESIRGGDEMAFVKMEFASVGDELDRLRGKEVLIESKDTGRENYPQPAGSSFTGWVLRDRKSSFSGTIIDFLGENTNPLFLLEMEGKQYYIPMQDEFIIKIDKKRKIIFMDLPEGIFGINE